MKIFWGCLLLEVWLCCTTGEKLPSNFQVCKENESDLSACLKSAIQDALPKLRNGVANLKVPALEPLTIPSATIGEGEGAVHVVQNYKNFQIHGIADTKMETVKATLTPTTFTADIDSFIPETRMEADYNLNGRILLLPIVGSGRCNITLKDVTTKLRFVSTTVDKKGETYWKCSEFKVSLTPGRVFYNFENLFNGDERLGKEMNAVLNENWKSVYDDVKTGYENLLEVVFKDYANKLFSRVPSNQVFVK